ncbi:MAG TPA: hypothetical protein VI749_08200 [Candidatus Omnitrophota bacterium]|nr:hypothetical protein [Candidatus Omnitrophota bacterium]
MNALQVILNLIFKGHATPKALVPLCLYTHKTDAVKCPAIWRTRIMRVVRSGAAQR